jgi:DNA-binding NtrC family response regulator
METSKITSQERVLLIVDDEPEIRQVLQMIAEGAGITVLTAGSGKEAMEVLQKHPVAAIISDMSMPNGDGKSLLFNIRASGLATPCAFLTAFETKDYIQDALRLGAYEFIAKPFAIEAVEGLMSRIVALGASIQNDPAQSTILRENALHQAMTYKKLLKTGS